MKKVLSLFAVFFAFVFLISCGAKTGEEAATKAEAPKKVAIVYSTGGKGDKSFNDSAFRGLQQAQKELGITFKEYEPKDTSAEAENALRQFAESGEHDLIIGVGFTMKDAVATVAAAFPDQKFAMVDDEVDLPNVASLKFKEHEGSFLVGALAAMMSKTNTVGFVGGLESPVIEKFQAGFEQGAKYVNPNIKTLSVYLGGANPFNDPASAKAKTETLIQQGADVVYHAAGGSGNGMFQAVKEKGVFAIGVDSNQDDIIPGFVLTSMLKNVDAAIFNTIKSILDGKFEAKVQEFGINENGVGTTDFKLTKDKIGEENIKKLEQIKEDIKAGKIQVKPTLN